MSDLSDHFTVGDKAESAGRFELARRSFEQGARLGDVSCLSRLANQYDVGIGVAVDKRHARLLYLRAWRLGCHVSGNNLAILHRETGNVRAMAWWFRRAADRGDDGARVELAKCHLHGWGVERSQMLALRHLQAALAGGDLCENESDEAAAIIASLAPRLVSDGGLATKCGG